VLRRPSPLFVFEYLRLALGKDRLRMTTIGRNDRCWCGSGKKFKHCDLRRSEEQPRPLRAIMHEVRQEAAFRTCLHPTASRTTCGKVVSAHTLQRSRVLAAIADEGNHVLTFYPI
jgi:hypothetical protein